MTDERLLKLIGKRVYDLRKKANLTQEDMMSYGFERRYYQRIESGQPFTQKPKQTCEGVWTLRIRVDEYRLVRRTSRTPNGLGGVEPCSGFSLVHVT